VLEAFSGAGPNLEGVVKVAAHKDAAETGISALESWRRSGNDFADLAAKRGAGIHPQASPDVLTRVDYNIKVGKAVILLAAKVLPGWLKLDLSGVSYTKPLRPQRGEGSPHD